MDLLEGLLELECGSERRRVALVRGALEPLGGAPALGLGGDVEHLAGVRVGMKVGGCVEGACAKEGVG